MKNQLKIVKSISLVCCFLMSFSAFSQQITVTGTVVDGESGDPLPGVTIQEVGTNNGANTDFDGNYTITVKDAAAKLKFSYLGYEEQTITVGNQRVLSVKLKTAVTGLDEIVVVGYGTARRRDLTGALVSVKGSEIEKGKPVSVQNGIAGRIAGVQISQTDNTPGAAMRVVVRGGSTLTGGNQPLYVIDGFPIIPDDGDSSQNALADLNPNDIASIEVLKDASATAVYGALGANGVVLITTKQGKIGKPQINVEYNSGVSTMTNKPNVLTPDEYLDWQIERGSQLNFLNSGNLSNVQYWIDVQNSGQQGSVWIDRITRSASTHQADISFSGGSDGMRYRLSAGHLAQEGVIKNSNFNRTNLSANIEQRLNQKMKMGARLTYSLKETRGLASVWDQNSLLKTVFQLNPFTPDDFDIADFPEDDGTFIWNAENPLTYINEVQNFSDSERFLGNIFFEYKPTNNLSWYTSYGINRFKNSDSAFYPNSVRRGFDVNGFARFRTRLYDNTNFQTRLNYNTNIAGHNINATAVFEARTNDETFQTFGAASFEEQSLGLFDLSTASQADFPVNILNERTALSFLARVGYSYNNKYLLTASFRGDADSRFGPNNKWGYFPSLALGWVASDEKFIKDLNTFDLLKVRMSYGVTGNSQIPAYQSLARLQAQRYIFGGEISVGYVPLSVANPDLKWETTDQYNIGLDLAFLNNRVSITADAYYKETNDLLLDVQLPITSGFTTAVKNVGSISNKGFELAINTVNIDTEDFRWNTTLTFSTNKTEVLDLGERDEMYFSRQFSFEFRDEIMLRVGEEVGTFVGFIEDEIYNSENEVNNTPESQIIENIPGQVKFKDINGDGVVNNADKVIIGNTQPDFIGGFNSEFTYKNFDFSFFLRWSVGNDVINANTLFLDRAGTGNWNTLQGFRDNAFSPLNPEGTVHGDVPQTYSSVMSSNLVEDGSFLKCDYITLGYTIPENTINNYGIRSLRLFARVNNPFMITRYSWFDPEVSTGFGTVAQVGPGVDFASFPRAVTFTVGASLKF